MNIELNLQVLSERLKYDLVFKAGVGKTCLSSQATQKQFESTHYPTVGFEFFTFTSKIEDKVVKLQIWDTCGQEIYRSLMRNLFRNTSLAIIVYSIDNRESFLSLYSWMKELKSHSNPNIKIFLIGNKCDLQNKREIQFEEGKKFQEENNINFFQETSALNGYNADKIFSEASKVLYLDYKNYRTIMGSAKDLQKSSKIHRICNSKYNQSSKSLLKSKRSESEKGTVNKSCCC